jgi:hypothetical protein
MRARAAVGWMALLGCNGDGERGSTFEMLVMVESDPGRPLAGAVISVSGKAEGTTAQDGRARLAFRGQEGEARELWIRCPDGFQSPPRPLVASLRRLSDPAKLPQYDAACPPLERLVVVAVRAENGPNLPVLYLGNEVGRTDAAGAAHVMLKMKPGTSFELVLSTAERGNEALRPQNPRLPFTVRAQDDLFVFEQHFTREGEPARNAPGHRTDR